MKKESIKILLGENKDRLADMVSKNLREFGISNDMLFFHSGKDILRYLFINSDGHSDKMNTSYVLILNTKLQDIYGVEVLRRMKSDKCLSKIPVVMISESDDYNTVRQCRKLGCNDYFLKFPDEDFSDSIKYLGHYVSNVIFPESINKTFI